MSQLFVGINLLKIGGGGVVVCRRHMNGGADRRGVCGKGIPLSSVGHGWGLGPQKNFLILSFEMLNF